VDSGTHKVYQSVTQVYRPAGSGSVVWGLWLLLVHLHRNVQHMDLQAQSNYVPDPTHISTVVVVKSLKLKLPIAHDNLDITTS